MKRRRQVGDLTRRRALALGAGLGLAPFPVTLAAEAEAVPPGPAAPIMTRPIPSTGERLPVVGLGTDEYYAGGPGQQATLGEVVRTLVAGGGTVVDTSSDYGASETLLAAALAESGLRPRIFIATKLEKQALRQAEMEGSLRRLGVSKIDLMQVHNVASAEQSLAPLRDWKAQGLVRYIGITTSETYAFDALEAVMRREKPDFVELNYSVGDREAEKRLLPAAVELGVATLIDIPFGGPGASRLGTRLRCRELGSVLAQIRARQPGGHMCHPWHQKPRAYGGQSRRRPWPPAQRPAASADCTVRRRSAVNAKIEEPRPASTVLAPCYQLLGCFDRLDAPVDQRRRHPRLIRLIGGGATSPSRRNVLASENWCPRHTIQAGRCPRATALSTR
jgi:diketogulonate reductase-like aldo/keto reductase